MRSTRLSDRHRTFARATFDTEQDVDFAFSWLDRARLRGSAFTQRGETALALRMIPSRIPELRRT